jgi:hypothetical protein
MSQDHKCVARIPGKFQQKTWTQTANLPAAQSGTVEVMRPRLCAKRATRFASVRYSELHYHMRREAKFEEVIPLCEECWARLGPGGAASFNATFDTFFKVPSKNNPGYYGSTIHRLRGTVGSVALLDEPPREGAVLTRTMKELLGIKANLKRIMSQKNVAFATPDQWRQVFEEALDEHVVGEVLDS